MGKKLFDFGIDGSIDITNRDVANVVRAKILSEMLEVARENGGEVGSVNLVRIVRKVFEEGELRLRNVRFDKDRVLEIGELISYLLVLVEDDIVWLMEDLAGDNFEVRDEVREDVGGIIIDDKV
jgi:hypothetical protein